MTGQRKSYLRDTVNTHPLTTESEQLVGVLLCPIRWDVEETVLVLLRYGNKRRVLVRVYVMTLIFTLKRANG